MTLAVKKSVLRPDPNILSDLWEETFVVVSSSNFFSNTMACSIEWTKAWCLFEQLLKISCYVFTRSEASQHSLSRDGRSIAQVEEG